MSHVPPSVESLYAAFPRVDAQVEGRAEDRPDFERIHPAKIPDPYRQLLVHTHHMTVTVESFYGQAVDVRVLDARLTGDTYCRKIVLTLRDSGEVVQFGAVRVHLAKLPPRVRHEIIEGETPLGRVLIQNNVLRHLEPGDYFRVTPCKQLRDWFEITEPTTCWGRTGTIFADGQPAVEVLEILAPVPQPWLPGC